MVRKSQGADSLTNVSGENEVKGKIVSGETKLGGGTSLGKGNNLTNDDLMKMIASLQEQVAKLSNPIVTKFAEDMAEVISDEFDSVKINQDDYIPIISLTPYPLNLTTKVGGKGGKIFSFPTFGSRKRILYSDLVEILETFQHFLSAGYFYIADKRVIRRHGLDDIYASILSKESIEKILDGNDNENTISLFKSANKIQQDLIIQMLIDKMVEGKKIDLNLIDKISRASGVKIQEKYEDTKRYVDSLNFNKEEK